jgi:hypothetical protein
MIEPYEVPYPFVVRKSGKVMSTRRLRKRGPVGAFGVKIASLTRMTSAREEKRILDSMKS